LKLNLVIAVVQLALVLPIAARRSATYLDPGSGSFLIQILIAAVLGGLLSARLWFGRILGVFRRSSSQNRSASSLADPDLDEADLDNGKGPGDAK
jgi:hypothetical protein